MGGSIYRFCCFSALGVSAILGTGPKVAAQGSLELANVHQDLSALHHQVAALRLSLEQMEADQHKLKAALEASKEECRQINKNCTALLAQHKKDMTDCLEQRHKAWIEEMQKLLTPGAEKPGIDYPKEGISYTIKKGDTLSKIAQEHRSKVAYIQAANHIQDPNKDVRPGQTIFIPQGK